MARLEGQPISFIPHKPRETMFRPDGTIVDTTTEELHPTPDVHVSRAAFSESDHVIVAMEEGVPVVFAAASEESGVTLLERPNAAVAAAHWNRGGDGHDTMVLFSMGANIGAARRRASSIKSRRATERDAIARLIAIQGSATGSQMANEAARVRDEEQYGKKVSIDVSIIEPDGTRTRLRSEGRKDRTNVLVVNKKNKQDLKKEADVIDLAKVRKEKAVEQKESEMPEDALVEEVYEDPAKLKEQELREKRLVTIRKELTSLEQAA